MLVSGHGGALEYDLMTRTRFTLSDIGGELPARALLAFVTHLPPDAALCRELRGDSDEEAAWRDQSLVPMLLAEVVDTAHMVAWEVAQANSDHDLRSSMPRPIGRPGVAESGGGRTYGSGAIAVSDFDDWWNGGTDGQR
ncbi:MAG: hypothetical protein MR611_10525 [Coriobacteriaceae bacterium]|nr:hypothetical protein [Coriobacteriaceae bacterium]